ncbi:hypothetical protein LCGC14_2988630, partial [marine sediment metagenome]
GNRHARKKAKRLMHLFNQNTRTQEEDRELFALEAELGVNRGVGKPNGGEEQWTKHWEGQGFTSIGVKKEAYWTCDGDVAGCPIAPKPKIVMPLEMFQSLWQLTALSNNEWIGYLIGKVENGRAVIEKVYFPEQTVTGASCEVPTEVKARPDTIGAIHSHVGMEAFWSKTDEDHANWPVEIVLNRKGDYKALMRVKLDCSRWSRVDCKLTVSASLPSKAMLESLEESIKKGREHAKPTAMVTYQPPVAIQRGGYQNAYGSWCNTCEKTHGLPRCVPVCAICGLPEHATGYGCASQRCNDCGTWHRPSEVCRPPDDAPPTRSNISYGLD